MYTTLEVRSTRHDRSVRVWCSANSTITTGYTGLAPSSARLWRQGFTCLSKCSSTRRPIRDRTWTRRKRRCSTPRLASRDQPSHSPKPIMSPNRTARSHPLNPLNPQGVGAAGMVAATTLRCKAVPIRTRPAEASQIGPHGGVGIIRIQPRTVREPTSQMVPYRTFQAVQRPTFQAVRRPTLQGVRHPTLQAARAATFQAARAPTLQAARPTTRQGALTTHTDEDLMSKVVDMCLEVLAATDSTGSTVPIRVGLSFSASPGIRDCDWRSPNLRRLAPFAWRLFASLAVASGTSCLWNLTL